MKHWENVDYQAISKAHIRDGTLVVLFANEDEVEIKLQSLLPFISENVLKNIFTENLQVTPYDVSIDLGNEEKIIPWDKIRVLTDRDFSRFLAQKAEEQAKLIGIKLKSLREKKGIKSNELADRSAITAQTISRIEKGHQDISFTTLKKLLASMGYSLKDLANEEAVVESEGNVVKTFSSLLKKLSKLGIDPGFVTKRIIPKNIQTQLNSLKDEQPDLLLDEAASYLSNIYGWSINDIWNSSELNLDNSLVEATLFKKGIKSNYSQIMAYIPYANFLAHTAVKSKNQNQNLPFPDAIEEFKIILETKYGGLNLESIIKYAWDMGICIIPLEDAGIFHGAAWKFENGFAIVVKQKNQSHAKWIFDILHELFHVFEHLKEDNKPLIETGEISPITKQDDIKEKQANSFANQIIFGGNAEEIAQEVVTHAKGKVELLQNSVVVIAKERGIRADSLANYLAHRLAYQGRSWWGNADTLQQTDPRPFDIAKEILLKNVDLKSLETIEFNLLKAALNF